MWTVGLEVVLVVTQYPKGMRLVVEQHAIDALGSDAANEAFRERVRPGCARWRLDHIDAFGGEHRVEGAGAENDVRPGHGGLTATTRSYVRGATPKLVVSLTADARGCLAVLLRLAYLAVTNGLAMLRLLPMSDRAKDVEILALRHQLAVLERQLHGQGHRVRFAPTNRRGWFSMAVNTK
jgi:hypothetical protein